jgi:hypothetical protein
MGFAQSGNLYHLRDAANVGQRSPTSRNLSANGRQANVEIHQIRSKLGLAHPGGTGVAVARVHPSIPEHFAPDPSIFLR